MKVSPSILACDFSQIGKEISRINTAKADMVHLDVMDGNFVPNISFGPPVIKSLRPLTTLLFDTHLMIDHPYDYIKSTAEAGADIITFHVESKSDVKQTIEEIKKYNKKVGLSLKPHTPIEEIFPYLEDLDLVLVMTVEPGFGGQTFMEDQMQKTVALKEEINSKNLNVLIEVDGGINLDTVHIVRKYPVDICVSGTCIFKSSNMEQTIKSLK